MKLPSRLLVALPLLLTAAFAHGQTSTPLAIPTTPVAIENTNAAYTPTTVDIPQANPSRPTITGPATIPPTGYLQFEQGFNRAVDSPSGISAQSSINQTTKISLTTRLLLQFSSQPYTYSATDGQPSAGDPGDLDLGVQYTVHKAVGALPTLALGYTRSVRFGTASNLDIGDYAQSALILFSGDLPLNIHYDSNLFLNEQSSDQNLASALHTLRRGQFAQTLSLTHPLFPAATANRLSAGMELAHFPQPFVTTASVRRANAVDLQLSLAFNLRPNLVLDIEYSRGLTSTSTQNQGGFGFTYLLPKRLWRDRHPVPIPVGPFHYAASH